MSILNCNKLTVRLDMKWVHTCTVDHSSFHNACSRYLKSRRDLLYLSVESCSDWLLSVDMSNQSMVSWMN